MSKIEITLKKSLIGSKPNQKKIAKALGLGKTGSKVVQEDNAGIRGSINKISHLLEVKEIA
jgi:large subunit ribosomal protein L30